MAEDHRSCSQFCQLQKSMAENVHPLAASGFDADQSVYESARPSYSPAVLQLVKRNVPLLGNIATASSLLLLDFAAWTAKWTRLLLSFGIDRLVAVEPSPGMRKEFEALHPHVLIPGNFATAFPSADESVDDIFIAHVWTFSLNISLDFEANQHPSLVTAILKEGHLETNFSCKNKMIASNFSVHHFCRLCCLLDDAESTSGLGPPVTCGGLSYDSLVHSGFSDYKD